MLGRRPFKGFRGAITSVAFSPDDSCAVVCGSAHVFRDDQAVRIFEIPFGRLLRLLGPNGGGVSCAVFSPDGRVIATGGRQIWRGNRCVQDDHISIWDARSGRQLRQFGEDVLTIAALAFSPDGKYLASGGTSWALPDTTRDEHAVRLWNWQSGEEVNHLGLHPASVDSLAFSPEGNVLVSGARRTRDPKSTVRAFDVVTGAELEPSQPYRGNVRSLSFSPTGHLLVSAGGEVIIWNLRSGQPSRRFAIPDDSWVNCAAVAPKGRWFAASIGGSDEPGQYTDCYLILFGLESGEEIARFQHRFPVEAFAISHDSRLILAGDDHGDLKLWETDGAFT